MNKKEVHLKLSEIKIDNDNLDYIKMVGEICGKLRDDLVKLFADSKSDDSYLTFIDFLKKNGYEIKKANPRHKPGEGYSPPQYYSDVNIDSATEHFQNQLK